MVVIIDPHFKRSQTYPVFKSASEKGLLVKPPSGEGEYDGWCWSGSSSWVDYFNPASWEWWKGLFRLDDNKGEWHWKESTKDVFIWNDMNEVRLYIFILEPVDTDPQPSVFNGPEITMPRDNIHYGGWEHRDVHNINGMLFVSSRFIVAVHNALKSFSTMPPPRP
jgi:alpha 1,3-glucosidase